jgi:DNA modification methylase
MYKGAFIQLNYEQLKEHKWFDSVSEEGNIFIHYQNEYNSNGELIYTFLDVIEQLKSQGLHYINTIIVPKNSNNSSHVLNDIVDYLIWFVKDYDKMYFNKDAIREKHIWKDVEWGKRKKNYNEKGKDPGNVWIPTEDDGKGNITHHIKLSLEEIINRTIKSTSLSSDHYLLVLKDNIDEEKLVSDRIYKIQKVDTVVFDSKINNNYISIEPEMLLRKVQSDIYFHTSENMWEIEDETVDLMVTSPPYWDLKNYFKKGQIGQEPYEVYLERLETVWREVYNKLKPTGSMWINVNIRTKNKMPILIPNDIIKQCKKIGFNLRDIVIWHKSSGIPTHAKNIVDRHEYFIWFTKSDQYLLNKDAINDFNDYKNEKLNKANMWNINRKAGSVGKDYIHPAIYPNELIERVILLCSRPGDLVLDPFLGSGTTVIAAHNLNRNSIGYEFNEGFYDLIKYRIENEVEDYQNVNFHLKTNIETNGILRTSEEKN